MWLKPTKRLPLAILLSALILASPPGSAVAAEKTQPPARPVPRLGMNLHGPADWNTELPFVDVFRLARPWISQEEGRPWGQGPELDLGEHGWVKRLAPDCRAETPI